MANRTHTPISLLDRWVQENNDLVDKWKQQVQGGTSSTEDNQRILKWCSSEFNKLSMKIQGIPATQGHAQLELTVVYNACLFGLTQTQFSETELLLVKGLERALEVTGCNAVPSDAPGFWRALLNALEKSALYSCVLQLLCVQWAIWLCTCRLESIQDLQDELFSLPERLGTGLEDYKRPVAMGTFPEKLLVVVEPRMLNELLQICTLISRGAVRLSEGHNSKALSDLRRGSTLPGPRALISNTHLLSGLCLAQMGRPQMALQCYRLALETDPRCVCALHRSTLIYRDLGNTQAEIQALRLLHSTLTLPPVRESSLVEPYLLHPSVLLRSPVLSSLLSVPSSLCVLHSLALKCVLCGRVSEGVEHYLDLLAARCLDEQHTVYAGLPSLPRLPELFLEAGTALLMAGRPRDCMALCDEVISTTSELLPERLILEEPDKESGPGPFSSGGTASEQDRLGMVLWAGAAHLLQAHCQAHLKDWKQAVTQYTRCINLLTKVYVKKKDFQLQIPATDMTGRQVSSVCILQRLKGLSLSGRGISFAQRDQLREALRDLHLSLQASPECVSAGMWLGEVLWRLERKQEAAACWEKTWSFTSEAPVVSFPLYLHESKSVPTLDPTNLRGKIEELAHT